MMRKTCVWKQNKKCEAKASDIFLFKPKKCYLLFHLETKIALWIYGSKTKNLMG